MIRRVLALAGVVALALAGYAYATHESTTELHVVPGTTVVVPDVTVTDEDPLPHPVTVTETVTITTPTEPPPPPPPPPPGDCPTCPPLQPDIDLTNQNWTCLGPQNRDLVRLTITVAEFNNDVLNMRSGCTGRIGRLEITAFSGHDMIDVNNAAVPPHDLVIECGFVRVRGTTAGAHQDGIQLTNDTPASNITLRNMVFSGLDTQHFISSSSVVQGVVCDGCTFLPEHDGLVPPHTQPNGGPANAMILDGSPGNPAFNHSGTRNSLVCVGSRFGNGVTAAGGAIGWIDPGAVGGNDAVPAPGSGNVLLPASDPLCQQPG